MRQEELLREQEERKEARMVTDGGLRGSRACKRRGDGRQGVGGQKDARDSRHPER